jgi:hypothetical protein
MILSIYSDEYGVKSSCAFNIDIAEFYFLKGKSTEFAIPIIVVFVFDFNIDLMSKLKAFS